MKARPGLCRLDRWCLTQTVRAGPGLVRAGAETGSAALAPAQNSDGWLTGGGVGGGMVVWLCGPTDSRWCVGAQLSPESEHRPYALFYADIAECRRVYPEISAL